MTPRGSKGWHRRPFDEIKFAYRAALSCYLLTIVFVGFGLTVPVFGTNYNVVICMLMSVASLTAAGLFTLGSKE